MVGFESRVHDDCTAKEESDYAELVGAGEKVFLQPSVDWIEDGK